MNVSLEWHKATEPPKVSGEYLVAYYCNSYYPSIATVNYSAKHNEWNNRDEYPPQSEEVKALWSKVEYWASVEELRKLPIAEQEAADDDKS